MRERTGADDLLAMHRDRWCGVMCDSLEKVFADVDPRPMDPQIPQHVLRGETVSVQLALLPPTDRRGEVSVTATGPGLIMTVSAVRLIPARFLAFADHDAGYLRDAPGLYPDLLRPHHRPEPVYPNQWQAFWVDVAVDDHARPGPVEVVITAEMAGEVVVEERVMVDVVDTPLGEPGLINTHWFHCDGLATHYGVEVWSEEHWRIIDRFLGAAAECRITSVLTPTWTPPLDTAVGHYRRPTQLIEIGERSGGSYTFGFDRLRRWLGLVAEHGITGIEIAHLFTQWGAEATPAIEVTTDGLPERRFGWDVPATDPTYRQLLEQLIPALRAVLAAEWGEENVIWHISDEPHGDQLASYERARTVVDDLLAGATVVDALSDFEYHRSGAVPVPVVATDAAEPFLAAGVDPLWLYFCVAQNRDVANRFFAMPSSRHRVIGLQLYRTAAAGFLHWGFNFYNSVGSLRTVDPFTEPDAGGGFPAGDPFLVYPGDDGAPWPSIRSRVFTEAMNDVALCRMVEQRRGRDGVLSIIDPDGALGLRTYSIDPDHYRRIRAALVSALDR